MSGLVHRGSFVEKDEYPDTKIPVLVLPKEITDLQSAIVELNMGKYGSNGHYGAVSFIDALDTHILFYRNPPNQWSLTNIRPLKHSLMDSLYLIDSSKELQGLMNREMGIRPVSIRKKNTRQTRKKKNKPANKRLRKTRRHRIS